MAICRMLFFQASVFVFILTRTTVNCGPDKVEHYLIKSVAGHRALMVIKTNGHPLLSACKLYTDEDIIHKFSKKSVTEIYIKDEKEFQNLADMCESLIHSVQRRQIHPNTNWCGPGNDAENYGDLGWARETDMCCRDHDHCDDYIVTGETKHNLTNNFWFTASSCRCDKKFYDCLKNSGEYTSYFVHYIFFNIGMECFTSDNPKLCRSTRTSEGSKIQCSPRKPVYYFVESSDYVERTN